MDPNDIRRLRQLTTFEQLVDYLRDELDWPIEADDAEEITFDYDPEELGIDPQHAVKIEEIRQIRPLSAEQPWGIFYLRFESKRLPVVVLRRILRALVPRSRRRTADQPVWPMSDLLFISSQGDPGHRSISFAHFRQRDDHVEELRTFSWDSQETHFYYIKNLNLEALRWPQDPRDVGAWRAQWRGAFQVEHHYTITTAQRLAQEMAHHATVIRELVREIYALEGQDDALHQIYSDFRANLLHDLDPGAFGDMVAQTLTYGLFSAATQTDHLTYEDMVALIPDTNPFLKGLLGTLASCGKLDLADLGVEELVAVLNTVDMDVVLQDIGRQSGGGREDPVIHFYESFLAEYDKSQKVKRGEFYTPDPVVSYIVRSVDYLLRTEFGLEDGLADTTVDPETGEPIVQILDPATGTGTFLAHVIDQIERTVKAKPGVDWNAYVSEHLLPRLNGFELMMAPYTVAHMKLGLKLRQTGYTFGGGERLRVYLTNTLEEPLEQHEALALVGFLTQESNEAARVKRRRSITVVLGNPPYSGHSANENEWIAGLLRGDDGRGNRVENYFEVDGQGLNERNPKWLNDDYVKFIRFAQWRIDQTGAGIVAFITNHGYLDNPTFRGMRQSLMADFDALYVLDLHGSTKKKETTPEGGPDENVFDIMPGVGIMLAVKHRDRPAREAAVRHTDLWGVRGHKYGVLARTSLESTAWADLEPARPFYLFVPQDTALRAEYQEGWKVTDIMSVNVLGFQTHRDDFAVAFDRGEIEERIAILRGRQLSDDAVRERFGLSDTGGWQVAAARRQLRADGEWRSAVIPCAYRPFDTRWCYFSTVAMDRPRRELLDHVAWRHNLCLLSSRQQANPGYRHSWVTREPANDCVVSTTSREANQVFPLYLYPDTAAATLFQASASTGVPGGRRPNLATEFTTDLVQAIDLQFIPDGRGDLGITCGPEDVFHFAYAVLNSPTYRARYAGFLKVDFPRLPLTSSRDLFRCLVLLGADLVALHLLEDDYAAASWVQRGKPSPLQQPITTFARRETGTKMGKFTKGTCYDGGRVYLDTSDRRCSSYFDGVPEDVWAFEIGGYQVLYKWLSDRRSTGNTPGRVLTEEDIAHYQRIVVALKETIRLMGEIDAVIDAHGGWPIA